MEPQELEKAFKMWEVEFFDKYGNDYDFQEFNFESIAVGFFTAKGYNLEQIMKIYNYCVTKNKY